MSVSHLKCVLRAVHNTKRLFFYFQWKEGPYSSLQLETAAGILLRSSVDAEGARGEDFSSEGWQATATKLLLRGPGPVGLISFLQLPEKHPLWELLRRSAGLPLPHKH